MEPNFPPAKPVSGCAWVFIAFCFLVFVFVVFGFVAALTSTPTSKPTSKPTGAYDDVGNLFKLGTAMQAVVMVNDFKVRGNKSLDLFIGSLSTEDAGLIADSTCLLAKKWGLQFEKPWTVRVFLVVGDRPAAVCELR